MNKFFVMVAMIFASFFALPAHAERIANFNLAEFNEYAQTADILRVNIFRGSQRVVVRHADETLYIWKTSTGDPSIPKAERTPAGAFHPFWLDIDHKSSEFGGALMPHSVFFYSGIAIHGSWAISDLGTRASHGCVRLRPDHAGTLFFLVKKYGLDDTYIVVY